MLGIIATISVLLLLALYVGLWVLDQVDPDPYDQTDDQP